MKYIDNYLGIMTVGHAMKFCRNTGIGKLLSRKSLVYFFLPQVMIKVVSRLVKFCTRRVAQN